jgi:hypothetical protein
MLAPIFARATGRRRESAVIDENDDVRMERMAHVGDLVLLEKPADHKSPKQIDCYLVEVENFDAA